VRLVQSGQYVEAIKLDQQFASTRLESSAQAPQAADRRRKTIEDVVAALPSIERQEIEEQLRAFGQRKPGALATKPTQSKAAAADLSMSWERISPPPRALPITSGAPRFVLGRPNYGYDPSKVVAGPVKEVPPVQQTVRPLLGLARAQGTEGAVPPGLNGASHVLNPTSALTPSLPSSRAGPRVGLFGPAPQTTKPLLNASGTGGNRPSSSLFPVKGLRDPRHLIDNQTVLYPQKATSHHEPLAKDLPLQKDVVPQFGGETVSDGEDQYDDRAQAPEPAPVAEYSESVFLSSRPEPSRHTRETTEPLLPGAFRAEREAAQLEQNPFAHSPPTPPTRLRPVKSRRTTRTSVPGGFDEDASGEEDNVPPLPEVSSVKRTTRRRVSRASSVDAEEEKVKNAPVETAIVKPRRSSRLSAASSSSEPPSPQKISAPKAKRKTRGSAGSSAATTGIASSTRSSTRKRR